MIFYCRAIMKYIKVYITKQATEIIKILKVFHHHKSKYLLYVIKANQKYLSKNDQH